MRIVEPTVRARTLEGFELLVRELGGDPARILRRVGIASDVTERPLEWISFPAVLRACEAVTDETRCPTFRIAPRNGPSVELSRSVAAHRLILARSTQRL
jgi:hypothetical protein